MNVRWYGSDSGYEFEIQLPAGALWRTFPNEEFERFRISAVDSHSDNEAEVEADSQRLLIQMLDSAQSDSVKLSLEWEWMPASVEENSSTTQVQLPIPKLLGVDHHRGTVDCIFSTAYALTFNEGAGARLVQQGRLANFLQQQMQFRFDRQEFDLSLTFRLEESLPTVRPTYKVSVDQNKLMLTAWFDCSFDTNNGHQLEIAVIPGDWIVEENTARVLQDQNDPFSPESEVLRVRRQDNGTYILNGREPENSVGGNRRLEQVWKIEAQRSWSPDDGQAIEFQIPEILRGKNNGSLDVDHGSGVLLVASADNILMQWRETASTGLLPDSFSTEYQKFINTSRVREPLAYRFQSRGSTPKWVGKAEFLPQQISFEQRCDLEILPNEIDVQQLFQLRIANEPFSDLRIAVREDVGPAPQVLINGNPTSMKLIGSFPASEAFGKEPKPTNTEADALPTAEQSWRLYQLDGAPLIGTAEVSVLTSVPYAIPATPTGSSPLETTGEMDKDPSTKPSENRGLSIPLAQLLLPTSSRSIRQDWDISSDLRMEVSSLSSDGTWEPIPFNEKRRTLRSAAVDINLQIRRMEVVAAAPVRIKENCLQSVIAGEKRRDRYIARVLSTAGKLNVQLPRVGDLESGGVAVDGVPLRQSDAPYDYNTKSLSISLPTTPVPQEHVVEIFYLIDDSLSWATPIRVESPRIEGAEYQGRFYWQLVTPSDKHLGWSPAGLTAEWTWQWSGLWWYRQSAQDQTSLERLLGSSVQARQPVSANSYVMSGQGPVKPQVVWVLSRFILWFPVGILAIALSVLVLSFPVLRSPLTAVLLAGCIVGLAMLWPDMAVLLGQTAIIALSLVALMLVTQAAIDVRVRRRSVFTTRPSTYMEGGSDNMSFARSGRVAPVTASGSAVASGDK